MFDIGFGELVLVAVVALLVLGPERLPEAVRTGAFWLRRLRRSVAAMKAELEREFNATELKQDLHNDAIMRQLKQEGQDITDNLDEVRASLKGLEYELDEAAGVSTRPGQTENR